MSKKIVIVGGLPGDPSRQELLRTLNDRTAGTIVWDWIQGLERQRFEPVKNPFQKLIHSLRQIRSNGGASAVDEELQVVKLYELHGRSQAALYSVCDPVLVPISINTVDDLTDWLFSPEANLIPRKEWNLNLREAALIAILAKLIKNKSWHKDKAGHKFTKEADLLGQSPVQRSEFQQIAVEAGRMLGKLEGGLLLTKGGTPGTPKGWCIHQKFLPAVKTLILTQSFTAFDGDPILTKIRTLIEDDDDRRYRGDGEIVNERIRDLCRAVHD